MVDKLQPRDDSGTGTGQLEILILRYYSVHAMTTKMELWSEIAVERDRLKLTPYQFDMLVLRIDCAYRLLMGL
jgi:hypothetical protein